VDLAVDFDPLFFLCDFEAFVMSSLPLFFGVALLAPLDFENFLRRARIKRKKRVKQKNPATIFATKIMTVRFTSGISESPPPSPLSDAKKV